MSLFGAIKGFAGKVASKFATPEAQFALSMTPLGAIGKAKGFATGIGKVAKFLFLGATPAKTVRKTAVTLGLGAVAAGGGGKLVVEGLKGIKKSTEKVVDYVVPKAAYGGAPAGLPMSYAYSAKGKPQFVVEAPTKAILKVAGAALGIAAVGAGAGYLAEKYYGDDALPPPVTPSLLPVGSPIAAAPVPVTPQTQTIEAGQRRKRRKVKRVSSEPRITIRNQNLNILRNYSKQRWH